MSAPDHSNDSHQQQFNTIIHEVGNESQFNNITPSTTHSRFDHTAQSEMTGGNQTIMEHVSSPTLNSCVVEHDLDHQIENKVHLNTTQNEFSPMPSPLQQNRGILNKESAEKPIRAKTKKPFLKKGGSRKEPSSLQRVDKEVLKKGMRFSNDGKGGDSSSQNNGNNDRQNTLAHLEQMQRQQLAKLEKRRMERRHQAREEIKQQRMITNPIKTKEGSSKNQRIIQETHNNIQTKVGSSDDEEESDCSDDEESIHSTLDRNVEEIQNKKMTKTLQLQDIKVVCAKTSQIHTRSEMLSNYDEVWNTLEGTEFEHLLQE